ITVAVVLLSPALLGLLAKLARPAPITMRLALRDLARYRVRSGAALAAISLSLLIAGGVCVVAAARFGEALDYTAANLASHQLRVYARSPRTVPGSGTTNGPPPRQAPGAYDRITEQKMKDAAPALSAAQVAAATAAAHGIAAGLGSSDIITLEGVFANLQHA